ncbi:MAG: DUF3368 domain-containing protein [Anaerolineae bacterium]|nr:DUF3368 domain-containing protein [Anaerolineae bacterium]MCX8067217.1 DUF3368 domain-containing protein [Anaerolineae bacterium]
MSLTGHLSILRAHFEQVVVPVSVYEEVVLRGKGRPGASEVEKADWIVVKEPLGKPSLPPALLGLGPGELDTILLAQELKADWVLMDDKLGRKVAHALGLRVKGTLGVLLTAYQTGLLTREMAEKAIDTLSKSPVWVSPRLVDWFKTQLTLKTQEASGE